LALLFRMEVTEVLGFPCLLLLLLLLLHSECYVMLCYLSLRLLLRLAKFFFLLLVARSRYRYGSFVTLLSRRSESDSSFQEYISPFELC
jgi:hypothetical protein